MCIYIYTYLHIYTQFFSTKTPIPNKNKTQQVAAFFPYSLFTLQAQNAVGYPCSWKASISCAPWSPPPSAAAAAAWTPRGRHGPPKRRGCQGRYAPWWARRQRWEDGIPRRPGSLRARKWKQVASRLVGGGRRNGGGGGGGGWCFFFWSGKGWLRRGWSWKFWFGCLGSKSDGMRFCVMPLTSEC